MLPTEIHHLPVLAIFLAPLVGAGPTGPASPSYVEDPSGRGTVSLVTSCIVTIGLCVWTAIHMNIHQSGTSWWKAFRVKLGWTTVAIFFPEYVLVTALTQFLYARETYKRRNMFIRSTAATEEIALMDNSDVVHTGCPVAVSRKNKQIERWTLAHGYFACMGGFEIKLKNDAKAQFLRPEGVAQLAEWNMLPDLTRKTVKARSKSSSLAKGLICIQVLWMFIQIIARKIAGLPVTLIELHTLAHIGAAIVLYSIWWHKPQDVEEPVTIDLSECTPCNEKIERDRARITSALGYWVFTDSAEMNMETNSTSLFHDVWIGMLAPITLGFAYGGIHAAAWNAHFPSYAERMIWRISACIVGVVPTIFAVVIKVEKYDHIYAIFGILTGILTAVVILPFGFARLFLVVEAFISVRSLPVGAYDTVTWSGLLPHIG